MTRSGGVIYPIVFHKLQPRIGFGWATRVIGFIELATLLISIAVMRVRVLPASTRKLIDWSALRDLSWVAFVIGGFVGFMGIYVPFFYIQYFAITTHLTDENLGFYLLAILNSLSAFGRILPNLVADKVGPLNMLIPFALLTGVLSLCLIGVHNKGGVIVIAALYGFTSGCFVWFRSFYRNSWLALTAVLRFPCPQPSLLNSPRIVASLEREWAWASVSSRLGFSLGVPYPAPFSTLMASTDCGDLVAHFQWLRA